MESMGVSLQNYLSVLYHVYTEDFVLIRFRCQCDNCHAMPNLRQSKCCQTTNVVDGRLDGLNCITEHEGFIVNCLNPHVLEVAYYDHVRQEGPREEHQRIHR